MTKLSRKAENFRKRKIWERRLVEWREEKISQSEYCRRNNLQTHQFTYWKKRLSACEPHPPAVSFLEVRLDPVRQSENSSTGLKIVINEQCHIAIERDFDPVVFQQVITILKHSSC